MSVLSRQKEESVAIVENTENPLSEGAGNKTRGRISAPAMQNTPSLPRIRKRKVLAVRQQLAEGRYDIDECLDSAVYRLLAAVTIWDDATGGSCLTVSPLPTGLSSEQDAAW